MNWGELILAGLATYLALGFGVAVFAAMVGLSRIDPAAWGTRIGFRLLVIPGIMALWPLLVSRLLGWQPNPPEEQTNHRHFRSKAKP